MNKFRMCLGGISAETCLKMDYFGNKSPKSPTGDPAPDSRLDLMTKECARPYFH